MAIRQSTSLGVATQSRQALIGCDHCRTPKYGEHHRTIWSARLGTAAKTDSSCGFGRSGVEECVFRIESDSAARSTQGVCL